MKVSGWRALGDIQPLDYYVSTAWKLPPGILSSVQLFETFSILAEVLKCWYVSMDRRSLNEIEFGRVETDSDGLWSGMTLWMVESQQIMGRSQLPLQGCFRMLLKLDVRLNGLAWPEVVHAEDKQMESLGRVL